MLVLGTDMRAHFEHLTKFKSKLAGEGFANIAESPNARKDMRLLLTVALHAADISNPAKPQTIATAWARRSMDEFFRQVPGGRLESPNARPPYPPACVLGPGWQR